MADDNEELRKVRSRLNLTLQQVAPWYRGGSTRSRISQIEHDISVSPSIRRGYLKALRAAARERDAKQRLQIRNFRKRINEMAANAKASKACPQTRAATDTLTERTRAAEDPV
jgi:hypothetical protein